jgi:putative peptidoglycan lipid II flippase
MSRQLLRSTTVVSSMTFLSRITGLMRDVVMANIIGTGAMADAFFVAFRIPNFLRRIFGEGAFSQTFVPVFAELRVRQDNEARIMVNHMAGRLGLTVLVLSVLGMLGAPWLVKIFAPGFMDEPEKFMATVDALRIMFPYLFFISLVAMSAGILNTEGVFAAPAITPVLLNLSLLGAILWLVPFTENAATALAIGVLIAGLVQLLFQAPFLVRVGYMPRPTLSGKNEPTKRVFRLMLPAIFGVSVAQINMLVSTFLASFLVTGSVSWLYYSDRLMEFPVGVFGIALATVVLPSLSKQYASGTPESYSGLLDWALKWVVLIGLPASAALVVLAVPLTATIYQNSDVFSDTDVLMSAEALIAFSIGVVGFVMIKILAPGFYARQDIKTPVRIAAIAMVANIVLSLVLVRGLAHTGLALSVALSAWLNAILLYLRLRKLGIYKPGKDWTAYLARIVFATACMTAVIWYWMGPAAEWLGGGLWSRVGHLSVLVVAGCLVYFSVLLVTGVRIKQLMFVPTDASDG